MTTVSRSSSTAGEKQWTFPNCWSTVQRWERPGKRHSLEEKHGGKLSGAASCDLPSCGVPERHPALHHVMIAAYCVSVLSQSAILVVHFRVRVSLSPVIIGLLKCLSSLSLSLTLLLLRIPRRSQTSYPLFAMLFSLSGFSISRT